MGRYEFFYKLVFFRTVVSPQNVPHSFQNFRGFQRFDKIFHGIIGNGRRVYDCGDADPDDRNSHGLLRKPVPVISHSGTGMDASIRDLDGPIQSSGISRRQRVDGDHQIRFRLVYHPFYNFQSFHSCLPHDTRYDGADQAGMLHPHGVFSVFLHDMPGHAQVIRHIRPQRVRRYLPVSQTYYEDGQIVRIQRPAPDQLLDIFGKLD